MQICKKYILFFDLIKVRIKAYLYLKIVSFRDGFHKPADQSLFLCFLRYLVQVLAWK